MLVLRDVVVPVDFEPAAYHALAYARELAAAFGARLHLLHVLDDQFALPGGTEAALSEFPQLGRCREQEVRERLNDLLTADDRKAGAHLAVRLSPSPAASIVAYAEQVQANAIVMGTHGCIDKPMGSAIGSVAEQVVRTAPCPVMVMRRHPQEALIRVEPQPRAVVETERA
jgi:nucleotide-binding universal stress UspA family protein